MHFSRKLPGTVSGVKNFAESIHCKHESKIKKIVAYPAHDLMFTHLRSDLKSGLSAECEVLLRSRQSAKCFCEAKHADTFNADNQAGSKNCHFSTFSLSSKCKLLLRFVLKMSISEK